MKRVLHIRYTSENFTSKSVDLVHVQKSILPWGSTLVHKLYHISHTVFIRTCSNFLEIGHVYDVIGIDWNILWSWTGAAH